MAKYHKNGTRSFPNSMANWFNARPQSLIGFVPESRKAEALFPVMSVMYNITLKTLKEFIRGIFVDSEKEIAITKEYVDSIGIKTPTYAQLVGNLSGGDQQKVIIGRWLATKPKILILDEPTKGVDVGAKAEIYAIYEQFGETGCGDYNDLFRIAGGCQHERPGYGDE
jgi:ABC-type sugar transport system ATPase subunit